MAGTTSPQCGGPRNGYVEAYYTEQVNAIGAGHPNYGPQATSPEVKQYLQAPERLLLEEPDLVNNPPHYNQVPGVECIDVTKHFSFLRGNAIKYLWRAGHKGDIRQDLEKAIFYIRKELDELP
jgi:hypothetical protein